MARSDDIEFDRPQVASPTRKWVAPVGFAAALALGGVVFWQLNENRTRIEHARMTDPAPGAQPIGLDSVPPPAIPVADPAPVLVSEAPPDLLAAAVAAQPAPPPSPDPEMASRLKSPSLIVDLSESRREGEGTNTTPGPSASAIAGALGGRSNAPGAATQSADERFAERLGLSTESEPVRGRSLASPRTMVVQGAVIAGVLETAINSDLPGYARALVSRDVRSFDGATVLIPRGSRLVGQYRSGVALGQSRAFVIWTRLIRPDGYNIDLASPGTDALGRGGLEGRVDRHFLQRFGGAILLSLISAGVQAATDVNDTQVIIASTRGAGDAASVALSRDLDIAPTVDVPQGTPIRIFVSRDLDFAGAPVLP